MNIVVTGRHMRLTENLKNYAEEKVRKLQRYLDNITEVDITMTVEKYRHKAEILLKVNGLLIQAESVTGEMYASIDEATEKLERRVRKYKDRLVSHRKGDEKHRISHEPEEPFPVIIKRKSFDVKPMTPEEAAMQMELLNKDFFIFTNASTGNINVLYRRRDGNLGLIEPIK